MSFETGSRPEYSLILASGSPQRKNLLSSAGYEFEIVIPRDSAECGTCSTGGPAALVLELAHRKAADVAQQLNNQRPEGCPASIILACDTVAECNGTILGKPTNEQHARKMLELLRGNIHRVYSGLCLWPHPTGQPETHLAVTQLQMDSISEDQLDEYLDSGLWHGKAGAFGYQDRPGWLHILEGSESNVIGLPMELLAQVLPS